MKANNDTLPATSLARLRRPSTVFSIGLGIGAVTLAHRFLANALANTYGSDFRMELVWATLGSQVLMWSWWLFSPLACHASWRFPLVGRKRWRNTLVHVCFALLFATATAALFVPLQYALSSAAWDASTEEDLYRAGLAWTIIVRTTLDFVAIPSLVAYGLVVTISQVVLKGRQLVEKETELTRAQLEAVRMQMSPHFLFNALHSVSALAGANSPKKATDLIARLGRALRESLAIRDEGTTMLEDELDMIDDILEIERVRLGDRLSVRVVASEEAMRAEVKRWLLQPLVENALVHGIALDADSGRLTITARIVEGSLLELVVIDDGAGLPSDHVEGIGLGNTRRRLRALFGNDASLHLAAPPEGGTRATLPLPVAERAAAAA